MKKRLKIVAIILAIIVILSTVVLASSNSFFELTNYKIKIGNSVVTMQYPIYINNDRLYVSLRGICDELEIPINWNEVNGEAEMDIYNKQVKVSDKTEFKQDGVIPDEETALIVGKAILEKYTDRSMEYETDERIYYLKATYLEKNNAWSITQFFDYKDGRGWAASGISMPIVKLNKNTGEVLFINTYSTFID